MEEKEEHKRRKLKGKAVEIVVKDKRRGKKGNQRRI